MQLSGKSRIAAVTLATALLIVGCRVWLAIDVPLTDTTEARYGEMARKMVETGDWLMPQHDYGVPYLAKPPLAIWMAAAGIRVLGPRELGPRLLILLSAIGFLLYLYRWVERELGSGAAATGVLVLMGSVLFFVAMAAVMTDLVLVACVNVALLAFWRRMQAGSKSHELVFFVATGLGVLAKGPLAGVLIGAPIVCWALACRRFRDVGARIGWGPGLLISALVALPWYVAAEWQHPGYLRYFLIGENLQRFLVADWKGDLYGPVHDLPHGTIWLFLLIAALPWSLCGAAVLFRARRTVVQNFRQHRELAVYMLAAAGVPMLIFTAAQNVIFPYSLPALVPGVITTLVLLGETTMSPGFVTKTALIASVTALTFVTSAAALRSRVEAESERDMLASIETEFSAPLNSLHYWRHRYFSAEYYSEGRISVLYDTDEVQRMLAQGDPFYLAMSDEQFDALPTELQASLQRLGEHSKKAVYGPAPVTTIAARTAIRP